MISPLGGAKSAVGEAGVRIGEGPVFAARRIVAGEAATRVGAGRFARSGGKIGERGSDWLMEWEVRH